ncbi:hypothetical protein IAR50_003256 [Cryptococcus sp. DSM 104548]
MTATPTTTHYASTDADLDGQPQLIQPAVPNEHSIDYKEAPESPEVLEKNRRKYSLGLYHWTRDMWENARQDMERRSSVSSSESAIDDSRQSPRKHQRARHSDVGKDVGAVPAYH